VGSLDLDSSLLQAKQFDDLLTSKTVPETDCQICQGSVVKALQVADRLIKKLSDLEFDTFLVGCSLTNSLATSDQILSDYVNDYQDLKFEIRKEVGLRVVKTLEKEVDFQYPDIAVVIDTAKFRFDLDIRSLYILGRYKKLTRGLPQTKWPCSKCRGRGCASCNQTGQQYPKTVETVISPYFLEKCQATDTAFHGAGREDIDALMLGTGRPFVLELKNPAIRSIDLQEAMDIINQQDDVKISELRYCEKDVIAFIKESSPDSRKTYRARIALDQPVELPKLQQLNELHDLRLDQRTPHRVSHRRADLVRDKTIYQVTVSHLDPQYPELEIEAQGGAYIKEFISGDEGRTVPSIASILDTPAVCTELDVVAVDDKGLFSA